MHKGKQISTISSLLAGSMFITGICRVICKRQTNGRTMILQAAFLCLLTFVTNVLAADTIETDAALKAAFVYNFSKFTEWPQETGGSSLVLCLHNITPALEQAFEPINGRMSNSKSIQLRTIEATSETRGCHMIFIGKGTQRTVIDKILARSVNLLSIGDAENFIEAGGIIALVEGTNRLKFDVNLAAAQRANLKISAQLLKLAHKVHDSDNLKGREGKVYGGEAK